MARETTHSDRDAAEFLASELTAANFAEFHRKIGETLRKYNENELVATDALWRIKHFYALVRKYNLNLEVQKQLFPPSPQKTGGPGQDHEAGERSDGKV